MLVLKYILTISLAFSIYACNSDKKQSMGDKQKEIEFGTLDSTNTYTFEEIGWKVRLPKDWAVQTKESAKRRKNLGKSIIKETTNKDIDITQTRNLISLVKSESNSFISVLSPYEPGLGPYEDLVKKSYSILKKVYAEKGIDATYREELASIDNLDFYVFKAEIYNEDRSRVIVNLNKYFRLINGYSFEMTLVFNNKADQVDLEDMIFFSKFSKRE